MHLWVLQDCKDSPDESLYKERYLVILGATWALNMAEACGTMLRCLSNWNRSCDIVAQSKSTRKPKRTKEICHKCFLSDTNDLRVQQCERSSAV